MELASSPAVVSAPPRDAECAVGQILHATATTRHAGVHGIALDLALAASATCSGGADPQAFTMAGGLDM